MDQVFSEITGTPGVLGLFVFGSPDKVLANTLTSRFDAPSLINTGKNLLKIHSTARMNIADVSEVLLLYEEALLLVKEITDKVLLVVMCEGSANPYLITMSIAMFLEELKAWAQRQQAPRPRLETEARPARLPKSPRQRSSWNPARWRTRSPACKPLWPGSWGPWRASYSWKLRANG